MKPTSAIAKGSLGHQGKCAFCGSNFTIGNPQYGFRRKYCSAMWAVEGLKTACSKVLKLI